MKYAINQGNRDRTLSWTCELGLELFLRDYAREMGISLSSAIRRLVLIGARCEKEHSKSVPSQDISTL